MTRVSTLRLAWELVKYRPLVFFFSAVMWTLVHSSPILFAVLIGRVFDRLAGDSTASPWTPVLIFSVLAIGRNGIIWIADLNWIRYWNEQGLQLRRNLLRWLVEAPRSRILPLAPGEAVSTFRDDVDDLLEYIENWVDLGGLVVFVIGAVAVMTSIDPALTGLLLGPLVFTALATQALGPEIRRRRHAMRTATEAVTGFIGETFAAVQAVKLAHAEVAVLDRFNELNRVRRKAALADTMLTEILRSINHNLAIVGSAIVLLVAAGKIDSGVFTVGELTVFLVYLPRLTDFMAFAGDVIAQHRRTGVAYERMRTLAVDAPDRALLDRTRVQLEREVGVATMAGTRTEPGLDRLSVRGLSYRHPPSGEGIEDIDLDLDLGSFSVITGRIGSGKTTLVRALLGLVPAIGEVCWNGVLVEDPASFFVPPRSAYTPQVPRLFSETLADNIALGQRVTRERLRDAVQLAVLDPDLERLEQGLDTMVGARGVKLSGGQIQRSAAARMFATEADLLVFDDLSSALDLHTEAELWERVFASRQATCLVVSHRRVALERADQILLMDRGRVVDRGLLPELLARSPLMRSLWAETYNEE